jgi:hypothetical protein
MIFPTEAYGSIARGMGYPLPDMGAGCRSNGERRFMLGGSVKMVWPDKAA